MATSAAAKAPAEIPADAPRKKSKLLLVVVLLLVLLTGGGAAAWFFLHQAEDDDDVPAPSKPAVFLPLDQFTVNLQSDDNQQFLQVAMTLKVTDQEVAEAIKAQMPEVRSRVLLLLSSKKASQLTTVEGKNQLAAEVMSEVEVPLPNDQARSRAKTKKAKVDDDDDGPKAKRKAKAKAAPKENTEEALPQRVLAVFFTHFIVQ